MIHNKINTTGCIEVPNSVFSVLSAKEKELLIKTMSFSFYKKNEFIYKEGDKPIGLICLSEGKVKVFKEGVGGRDQIIKMVKPLGFIGFRALLADENYLASSVAIEDSTVCIIDKEGLFKLFKTNNEFLFAMTKLIATELGLSMSRTVTLTQKHIRGRLAESLIFLKDTYDYEEDGVTLSVYLSREDIASLSNMTTSNAIRTLSIFAGEKIISVEGRKIKILDFKKLERISELG